MEFLSSKDTFDCTLFNLGFLMLYKGNFSSERERERQRETERDKETDRERQRDRDRDRETDRETFN